jgi:hypothetical protein
MNLIDVFALFAIAAVTFFICSCRRSSRINRIRAERMARYFEIAIRAEATLLRAR